MLVLVILHATSSQTEMAPTCSQDTIQRVTPECPLALSVSSFYPCFVSCCTWTVQVVPTSSWDECICAINSKMSVFNMTATIDFIIKLSSWQQGSSLFCCSSTRRPKVSFSYQTQPLELPAVEISGYLLLALPPCWLWWMKRKLFNVLSWYCL